MANDFEKVIDEEIESLHKWQRNPPETAPKDRRILVESDGDFFCANWVKIHIRMMKLGLWLS